LPGSPASLRNWLNLLEKDAGPGYNQRLCAVLVDLRFFPESWLVLLVATGMTPKRTALSNSQAMPKPHSLVSFLH
jgi:hypothetical protein